MAVINASNSHKVAHKDKPARLARYQEFMDNDMDVLVLTYYNLLHDGLRKEKDPFNPKKKELFVGPLFDIVKDIDIATVYDEAHTLTAIDPPSMTYKACQILSVMSKYRYGLTATPIANTLLDLYGIYNILSPGTFTSLTDFKKFYCVISNYTIIPKKGGAKGRRVTLEKIKSYKNIDELKKVIYPIYYGHRKNEVEEQLPELVQKVIRLPLTVEQRDVYDLIEAEAIRELIDLSSDEDLFYYDNVDLDTDDDAELLPEMNLEHSLAKATRLQQAANSTELLPINFKKNGSVKLDELERALTNDLKDDKVVVFSKFREMVDLVEARLREKGIKCARVTGAEGDKEKYDNMKKFQEDPDIKVCLITKAGSASINLQVAQYLVLLDIPWSLSSLVQLIGRIHRFGSEHAKAVVIFLLGEDTVDEVVYDTVKKKKDLSDIIMDGSDIGDMEDYTFTNRDFLEYIKKVKHG
jgi:SNF2 family DNA or RNA helicase